MPAPGEAGAPSACPLHADCKLQAASGWLSQAVVGLSLWDVLPEGLRCSCRVQLGDNPVYAANKDSEQRSQMGFPNGLQEGDEDYEQGPVGYPTPASTYAKQPSLPAHAPHMSG